MGKSSRLWFFLILTTLLATHSAAQAAFVRVSASAPVRVTKIYANEWGSPFVNFDSTVHAACAGGNGLYLYNLEASPNVQFRNNKFALLLTAQSLDKPVVLDYFYDASKTGWEACYIHGIYL